MTLTLEELEEIDRYDRQMLLPGWGAAGQERLRAASVIVGGRGIAAELCARYLAAAGVGRLVVEAFAEEAGAINPLIHVREAAPEELFEAHGILPRVPLEPGGQPEPDPPLPLDPEHPDQPAPDRPEPEGPTPEEPAVSRVLGTAVRLCAADDRAATGCALAVETIKAILGLPHHARVSLAITGARG